MLNAFRRSVSPKTCSPRFLAGMMCLTPDVVSSRAVFALTTQPKFQNPAPQRSMFFRHCLGPRMCFCVLLRSLAGRGGVSMRIRCVLAAWKRPKHALGSLTARKWVNFAYMYTFEWFCAVWCVAHEHRLNCSSAVLVRGC